MKTLLRHLWFTMSDATRVVVVMSGLMVTTPLWTTPEVWSVAAPLGAANRAILTLLQGRLR
jgi:hypothetical protein